MEKMSADSFKESFPEIMSQVLAKHEAVTITTDKGNAVFLSKDDYDSMLEKTKIS